MPIGSPGILDAVIEKKSADHDDCDPSQLIEKISLNDQMKPATAEDIVAQKLETKKNQTYNCITISTAQLLRQTDGTNERQMFTKDEKYALQVEADSRSIFVGNIPPEVTPEIIEEHFQTCGILKRITLLYDKNTGAPKGYAYVEFEDQSAQERALAFNGTELKGRSVNVYKKRTNLPGYHRNSPYKKDNLYYRQQLYHTSGDDFQDFNDMGLYQPSFRHILRGNNDRDSHRGSKKESPYRSPHKANWPDHGKSPPSSVQVEEKANSKNDQTEHLTTQVRK